MPRPGHPRTHLPALDGLRGLAVLMVLFSHLSERFGFLPNPWQIIPVFLSAGWTGVDLFFVLSGFLITGILWESRAAPHYFKNFYARRTLRLFPLYYATLIILFVVTPLLVPLIEHRSALLGDLAVHLRTSDTAAGYWLWYFTYFADVLFSARGLMFPGHFWSLAVEEHFYLMWPFLIHRLKHGTLIKITGGIVIGTLIVRFWVFPYVTIFGLYCLTPYRMDGLAMGAMIALIMRNKGGIESLKRFARIASPCIVALCAILSYFCEKGYWGEKGLWSQYGLLQQTVGYSLTPALYSCLLIATLANQATARVFSSRFLRFFGKYSYAIYVFHPLAANYVEPFFSIGKPNHYSIINAAFHGGTVMVPGHSRLMDTIDGACYVGSVVGITLLASLISWRLIELPFLNLKKYFPYESKRPSSGAELVSSMAENTGTVSLPGDLPPG